MASVNLLFSSIIRIIRSFNSTIASSYDFISLSLIAINTSSKRFLSLLNFQKDNPLANKKTPAIDHPTGPAIARKAFPAAIPPPPATSDPPPSHANAALVAAAPLKVEMAVPVDATPKVVAIPIATVGPIVTTATPIPAPAAAAPVFFTVAFL